jgi:hypothetical protein
MVEAGELLVPRGDVQVSHPCYFLFGVVIILWRSQRSSPWFAANDQKFFEGGRIMDESKNEPKTANDAPFWFNPQGEQMRVKRFDKDSRILDAVGDTTSVRIILLDASDEQRWILRWCVVRNNYTSAGGLVFTARQLRAAFGASLNLTQGNSAKLVKEPFNAEVGQEGLFIRRGPYLNIPGPDTGGDDNSNASIQLTKEITEAVRELTRP